MQDVGVSGTRDPADGCRRAGQLELDVDGERLILDTGDTTTFSARTRHNWRNPLDTETEVHHHRRGPT